MSVQVRKCGRRLQSLSPMLILLIAELKSASTDYDQASSAVATRDSIITSHIAIIIYCTKADRQGDGTDLGHTRETEAHTTTHGQYVRRNPGGPSRQFAPSRLVMFSHRQTSSTADDVTLVWHPAAPTRPDGMGAVVVTATRTSEQTREAGECACAHAPLPPPPSR